MIVSPRFGGLRTSLIVAVIAAAVVLVFTAVLVERPLLAYRANARAQRFLESVAARIDAALRKGVAPTRLIYAEAAAAGTRLQLFDRDFALIADTAQAPAARPASQPWQQADLREASRLGRVWRPQAPHDGRRVSVLVVRRDDGTLLRLQQPRFSAELTQDLIGELLLVAAFLAVGVVLLLTLVLSRTVLEPLRSLTEAANILATGELSLRIRSERSDELGILGRALDRMADRLEAQLSTLQTEEARLRAVVNSMVEAVFVTDHERKVVLTNGAFVRLVGKRIAGTPVREAIPFPALLRAVRQARKGEAQRVTLSLVRDKQARELEAQISPLPNKQGVVAVMHDITDIRRADAVRRDFVANASHELRTPLTAIRGFTETLLDGEVDRESARRFLSVILTHTQRLERIVADMLALSRAESVEGDLPLTVLDLHPEAAEVVRGLSQQAESKGIALELVGGRAVTALGHEQSVHEILLNLVDNAIKYTPAGGRVRVSLETHRRRAVVEVRDNGPGVPQALRDRIFERFFRVDAGRSRAVGGTGLGLAIVKHLATRMRADVSLECPEEGGSVFRLTLRRPRERTRSQAG